MNTNGGNNIKICNDLNLSNLEKYFLEELSKSEESSNKNEEFYLNNWLESMREKGPDDFEKVIRKIEQNMISLENIISKKIIEIKILDIIKNVKKLKENKGKINIIIKNLYNNLDKFDKILEKYPELDL